MIDRNIIKQNKYLVIGILVALGVVFMLLARSSMKSKRHFREKELPTVSTMTVYPTTGAVVLKSIGTAISNESVDIMSHVTQAVNSIHFSDCEYVKKGQLLVQMNIEKKTAEKKQAEISLREQEREFQRLEILKQKNVVSAKDYDTQKTRLHDAQAKLDVIKADLKESSILAPFNGVLGIRKVSVGALLTPGSIITTIDDIDKIKVDFALPEKYSLLLKHGLRITVRSAALKDKKFEGVILAVVPRVSAVSRSITVRGRVDNPDHLLKPGMMLKISLKLKDREILRIPERALASIGERHYVFVLNRNKYVKRKYVDIGERSHGFVEIESGLNVGEKIVSDGISKLSDGDVVTVVKDETDGLIKSMKRSLVKNEEE
ncbi:MAG: efflux RND transporter periplasmic adaptor subunit [Holosporaceae bacterium]|jgi:membrane fusion protein (multidrug efflux system)|nr:efflux RND transporter periplasmic adaptor subunit [Holosporaceae bacterium]